jgi:hypothetical protein
MKLVFVIFWIILPWSLSAQPEHNFQDLTIHLRVAKDSAPVVSLFIQQGGAIVLWRNNNSENQEKKNNGLFKGIINEREYNQILSLLSSCEFHSSNSQSNETIYPVATVITLTSTSENPIVKLSNYLVKYANSVKFKKFSGYYDFDL